MLATRERLYTYPNDGDVAFAEDERSDNKRGQRDMQRERIDHEAWQSPARVGAGAPNRWLHGHTRIAGIVTSTPRART